MLTSPMLIYGDPVLAKKDILQIKSKHSNKEWVELSLENNTLDQIRMEAGIIGFGFSEKILLIKDLINQKLVRDFLIDLLSTSNSNVKILIWDSEQIIKSDPKTKTINSTWSDFIDTIKSFKNHKILFFGEDFTDKEEPNIVKYIQSLFLKFNKEISYDAALTMSTIVGGKRNFLVSEIEKLALTAPNIIDKSFITQNAYPVSQDAILWKFGNIIDEGNFIKSIATMNDYIKNGIHPNIISEILCKKARWQLAIAQLWNTDMSWEDIEQYILQMGKFPSSLWHSDEPHSTKKAVSEKLKDPLLALDWIDKNTGLPLHYFKSLQEKGAKIKGGETIPMPFIAQIMTQHIKNKIIIPNSKKIPKEELKKKLLDKAVKTYNIVIDSMKNMRYNSLFEQELYEMVRALSDYRI